MAWSRGATRTRLEAAYATKWLKYPIADAGHADAPDQWQSVHGGFDTTIINQDPNRMVPLDALRALEQEGAFGQLHDQLYTTVGNTSAIPTMRRFAAGDGRGAEGRGGGGGDPHRGLRVLLSRRCRDG